MEFDDEIDRDDILEQYLEEEGLLLVPVEFMKELMVLMEAHIETVCEVDREELNDILVRLEDLLGEDGMMDLSIDSIIGWVNTLKTV
jgi:hypothetical protein